jgi:hypothetical protein
VSRSNNNSKCNNNNSNKNKQLVEDGSAGSDLVKVKKDLQRSQSSIQQHWHTLNFMLARMLL